MDDSQNTLDFERTLQATERTFLAYIRTSLTFFAVGATFIKFFDSTILRVFGWLFIPCAVIIFIFGLRHYRKITNHIFRIKRQG